MHTHLFRAALAAIVVLLPVRSEAQHTSIATARPPQQSAQAVAGELLAHRQELSLMRAQVDSLTTLANQIRGDRGRLQIAGLDRVPGKSVPRIARVYPVRRAARDMALRLLTADQRVEADKFLHDRQPAKTAHR
jgi:hypothetical protein